MLNIGIEFNLHDFEYDVYSLVKAFYPAAEVKNFYTGEETAGDFSILLRMVYEKDKITAILLEKDSVVARKSAEIDYEKNREETKKAQARL